MPRRILVTGAGGFVGRHALPEILKRMAPDDRLCAAHLQQRAETSSDVVWERVDLLDPRATKGLVSGFAPTHVLHLAAAASVAIAAASPANTWRPNLIGTLNLAEAMAGLETPATFLFASSSEVYGLSFRDGRPLAEGDLPQPVGPYARSKLAGEFVLADVLPPQHRLIVLRPFNHIGPGQDESFVAASFAGQIARAEAGLSSAVILTGDLSAQREFLDVRDVARAYADLIDRSDALPARATYNICSGATRPVADLLDGLRRLASVPIESKVDPARLRPNDIPRACGDGSALTAAIGWTARHEFRDTLRTVIEDARSRNAR